LSYVCSALTFPAYSQLPRQIAFGRERTARLRALRARDPSLGRGDEGTGDEHVGVAHRGGTVVGTGNVLGRVRGATGEELHVRR
jgi:hypothetical protein